MYSIGIPTDEIVSIWNQSQRVDVYDSIFIQSFIVSLFDIQGFHIFVAWKNSSLCIFSSSIFSIAIILKRRIIVYSTF